MNPQDKLRGALGLCRRAGALPAGYDAVCEAAQNGKAALVLLAADAAENTAQKVRRACLGRCPVLKIPLCQDDVAALCGKRAAVLAVTDANLAALCRKAAPPG